MENCNGEKKPNRNPKIIVGKTSKLYNMRNLFKLTLALALFFVLSCEKEELTNDTNISLNANNPSITNKTNQNDIEIYKSIISLNDLEEQRLAFATLNPSQRFSVWMLKLDNFKKNNSLNKVQSNFINELQSELKVSLFTDNNDNNNEKINFKATRKEYFLNKAISLFGVNEGRYLLTKVENINQTIDKLNNGIIANKFAGPGLRSCNCEGNSECVRLTGISIWGISWEYGTCPSGGCYVQVYLGIWESDNTGRCSY